MERVGHELRSRRAQVVVVQERAGPARASVGSRSRHCEPLGATEGGDPLLHHRRRRAGLHLEAEREDDERERSPVRLDLAPQRPHLLEEAVQRLAHARRVGLAEEPLDGVDLAALGVHQQAHERRALVQRRAASAAGRSRLLKSSGMSLRHTASSAWSGRYGARDPLPRDPLLPRRPAPERDVHHLGAPALGREARLEQLRIGLLRRELGPERHAVPEDRDPRHALGLLPRPRAVAQAVAR